jgi:hypothetical protein
LPYKLKRKEMPIRVLMGKDKREFCQEVLDINGRLILA